MSEQVHVQDRVERVLESDDRFVSGRWRGFWIQDPCRSKTELNLEFCAGIVSGEGYDWVGAFAIRGTYDVETGKVSWTKTYVCSHTVQYDGVAEVKNGIWGMWSMCDFGRGGFQIWPDAELGESRSRYAEAERPLEVEIDWLAVDERMLAGIGEQ